jgi:hypothetical protein
MTTPANQPPQPILPGCTDYSPFSLDELWAMISPADTVSQPQIDGWLNMAILCQDQADTLSRALTNLAEHWPPTPKSASEAFGKLVQGLVASMTDDASAAQKMSGTLSDIVGTLASAKNQMQPLMDQQARFQQMSPATEFTNIAAARVAPHSPDGWQADLREQATAIMASTDARIESLAAKIPKINEYTAHRTVGGSNGGGSGNSDGGPLSNGQALVRHLPAPSLGLLPPGANIASASPQLHDPAQLGTNPAQGQPVLAGTPVDARSAASTLGPSTAGGSPYRIGVVPGGAGKAPPNATQLRPGESPVIARGNVDSALGVDDSAHASAGLPMVPPAMVGRPASTSGRSAPRPGGRAALWYSQRQQKRDHRDPWSVPQGVPPVIEAPPEPQDHDPGPGVIGIDA